MVHLKTMNEKLQKLLKMVFPILWLAWFGLLPVTFIAIVVTGQSHWNRFWWMSSAVLSLAAWINGFLRRREALARGVQAGREVGWDRGGPDGVEAEASMVREGRHGIPHAGVSCRAAEPRGTRGGR